MRSSCLALLAGLIALGVFTPAPAAAQAPPMEPGMWAISVRMNMPNMPVEMPPITTSRCVTPDMLASRDDFFAGGPMAGPAGADPDQNDCMVQDYEVEGQTMRWTMVCTQPQALTMQGEITFSDTRYTGTMTSTTPQGPMTMDLDAQRTGDCE